MPKQYEIHWDERQVWSNTAFITADSEDEVERKFIAQEFDHPIDSEYSHTEDIVNHMVNVIELVEEAEEEPSVSSNP